MDIIEETVALGVPFCHFKTNVNRNQYNLTYTKTERPNEYEVHLIPLNIMHPTGKILFDKEMRNFICNKVHQFMLKNNCEIYFNVNCIGLNNEFLVWKFLRWLRCSTLTATTEVKITEDNTHSIRLFEFFIRK